MTVTVIDFYFGVIVAVKDYFDALGKSLDPTEEAQSHSGELCSPEMGQSLHLGAEELEALRLQFGEDVDAEGYKIDAQEDFMSDMYGKRLPITSDQESEILTADRLTHDIEESCPLVIGIHLGCIYERHRDDNSKVTNIYSLTQIFETRDKLHMELSRIEAINPKMYALLKDKELQLVMVQNDCYDCS